MEFMNERSRYENGCLAHDLGEILAVCALELAVRTEPEPPATDDNEDDRSA